MIWRKFEYLTKDFEFDFWISDVCLNLKSWTSDFISWKIFQNYFIFQFFNFQTDNKKNELTKKNFLVPQKKSKNSPCKFSVESLTKIESPDLFEESAKILFLCVQWIRGIPPFVQLSQNDQESLLITNWHELFLLTAVQCDLQFNQGIHFHLILSPYSPSIFNQLNNYFTYSCYEFETNWA